MSPNTPTSQVDAPQQGLTGRLLAGLRNRALALLAVASTAACDSDSENGRVPVTTHPDDAENPEGSTGGNASDAETSGSMGGTGGEAGTDGQGGTTGGNPDEGTTTTTSNPDQGSTGGGDTGSESNMPGMLEFADGTPVVIAVNQPLGGIVINHEYNYGVRYENSCDNPVKSIVCPYDAKSPEWNCEVKTTLAEDELTKDCKITVYGVSQKGEPGEENTETFTVFR